MSKLRKSFITVFAVLLCAVLCISAGLFMPKTENKVAEANTVSSNKNVDDLIASSNNGIVYFNYENLKKLYGNINASNSNSYKAIVTMLGTQNTYSAADLVSNAGGDEYVVKFAGQQWIPAYLSRTDGTSGDVILTLFLAQSSSQTGSGVQWSGHSTVYSKVSGGIHTYPTAMYSSSRARAYLTGSTI